jgi:ABA sandwich protein
MTAGRELDALVAEKVFGWTRCTMAGHGPECSYWFDSDGNGHNQDLFSDDIAAAWMVVEQLQKQDYKTVIMANLTRPPLYTVTMASMSQEDVVVITAYTAPLAICLAALKAVDVEVPA